MSKLGCELNEKLAGNFTSQFCFGGQMIISTRLWLLSSS